MSKLLFSETTIRQARRIAERAPPADCDPKVEALVNDLIGRVADKWTMIILEVLAERRELRFTQLASAGLWDQLENADANAGARWSATAWLIRTCTPSCRPRVDYRLHGLVGASFQALARGVWIWAEQNLASVEASRQALDEKTVKL